MRANQITNGGWRTHAFVACMRPSVEDHLIHPQMRGSTTHTSQKSPYVGYPGRTLVYDSLKRLTSVNESGLWSQSYGYDPYGNRTSVTSPTYMPTYAPAPAINASNNRISDVNFAYDSAGNLTQAPVAPGAAAQTFAYDAENKLVNFNSGAATYSYDGDGRRVKKVIGTTTTVFVYNVQDQLVAEYTTPAPTTTGGTNYLTADHLGSTRVVTNASGTVIARHDYLPFGEEIPSLFGNRSAVAGYDNTDNTRQKFTGKERDSESGLDFFIARYHASTLGRFLSSDPDNASAFENLDDPQSWNGYAYGRNNPLLFLDPNGETFTVCQVDANGKETNCTAKDKQLSDEQFREFQKDASNVLMFKDGKIFDKASGTQIGTFRQTDVDLDPGVAAALHQAGIQAEIGIKEGAIIMAENAAFAGVGAALGIVGRALPELAELRIFKDIKVVVNTVHAFRPGHVSVAADKAIGAVENAVRIGRYRTVLEGTNEIVRGEVVVDGVRIGFKGKFVEGTARISTIFDIKVKP